MKKLSLVMLFTATVLSASAQLQVSGNLRILRPLTLKIEDLSGKTILETKIESNKEFKTRKIDIVSDLYKLTIGEYSEMIILQNKPLSLKGYLNDKEKLPAMSAGADVLSSRLKYEGDLALNERQKELIKQYRFLKNDDKKITEFMESNKGENFLVMASLLNTIKPKVYEYYEIVSVGMKDHSTSQLAKYIGAEMKTMVSYKVGGSVENFTLVDRDRKEVSLADFKGKIVLLDFWASWCNPCRIEMKSLHKIYSELKGDDLVFISISLDEDRDKWLKAMDTDNIPWVALWDKDGFKNSRFREQFGFNGIPFIVLIDKEGKTIVRGIRGENVRKEIEKVRINYKK